MKTRLEQLTIEEFIRILSGDYGPLGIFKTPERLMKVARDIIMEYRSIADPSGARNYLHDNEDSTKARNAVLFFTILSVLCDMEQMDDVVALLEEYGVRCATMSLSRLKAEVKSKLAKAENTLKRIEEENLDSPKESDIRRDFDRQTAAMMAHFKFQIDLSSMKATLYAHLVARFHREVKAQHEAYKKMKK